MEKLVRRINTLSRRFEWWYFRKDRISISIWKLDRKMKKTYGKWRKIELPKCRFFLDFSKGVPFTKSSKIDFFKNGFSFHLTIKFSYGFQNSIISKIPPKSPRWQSVEYTYNFFLTFVEFRYEFQQSVKMYRVTVKFGTLLGNRTFNQSDPVRKLCPPKSSTCDDAKVESLIDSPREYAF